MRWVLLWVQLDFRGNWGTERVNRKTHFPCGSSLDYSHRTLYLGHFWSPNVWRFLPHQAILWHQLGVLYLTPLYCVPGNSVRSHSLKSQSYTPVPHPLPHTSDASHKSRLSPVLLTNCSRSEVLVIPSSSSINLLEMFTELRKTVYLLDHQFIIKGYDKKKYRWTSRWKLHAEQGLWE